MKVGDLQEALSSLDPEDEFDIGFKQGEPRQEKTFGVEQRYLELDSEPLVKAVLIVGNIYIPLN